MIEWKIFYSGIEWGFENQYSILLYDHPNLITIWIIRNQRKTTFKKNDRRDKIIMNCFSISSWETCLWCRTNDYLRHCIKHILIEKAQSHKRLKMRIFKIRAMWLRYHKSIYVSTTIDDEWEIELRLDCKTRTCNFEQKQRINSIWFHRHRHKSLKSKRESYWRKSRIFWNSQNNWYNEKIIKKDINRV